jgi:bifunctional non-homologous end joining protein LigD
MFAKACETGLEGIIPKEANAPYIAGRQRSWLKIKCSLRQEFVIVGYSDPRKGDRALGALHLAYQKNGVLQYAGKVGTGFSMQSARELAGRLEKIGVKTPILSRSETVGLAAGEWRSVHWVKPMLLCEIAFTEWTGDGHIRHPSFQGLREDKDPSQVNQEQPMLTSTATKSATGKRNSKKLELSGVSITHPGRVISETGHITKGELAGYYAGIASLILPQIERHPLSLLRCPSGIDKQCFFQRNPGRGLGDHVQTFEFKNKGKAYEYLYIEDEKGLMEIIQMGGIELHRGQRVWTRSIIPTDDLRSGSGSRGPVRGAEAGGPGLEAALSAQGIGFDTQVHRREGIARHGSAWRQRQMACCQSFCGCFWLRRWWLPRRTPISPR